MEAGSQVESKPKSEYVVSKYLFSMRKKKKTILLLKHKQLYKVQISEHSVIVTNQERKNKQTKKAEGPARTGSAFQ